MQCETTGNPNNVCVPGAADDTNWFTDAVFKTTDESQTDWKAPFVDSDPDNFWCTKANTTAGAALIP